MSVEATRLAGITTVDMASARGPRVAYLFEPHRLALSAWAHALGDGPPATLLTLDRHTDTLPPHNPAAIPHRSAGLRALDEHVRWDLRTTNNDHILAAMEAGVLAHVVVVARTHLPGSVVSGTHVDRSGVAHHVHTVASVVQLVDTFGAAQPPPAVAALRAGGPLLLDVDLDAFTSMADADPTEVLPWPVDVARRYLMPPESRAFWDAVLPRCLAFTLALEPAHCGGVLAAAQLHAALAPLLWHELLGVPPP